MSDDAARWAALKRSVDDQAVQDPLVRPRVAGQQLFLDLSTLLKDERGVHLETFATVLGALGGCAARHAALAGLRLQLPDYRGKAPVVVTDAGVEYLMGDALNWPLLERPLSFWTVVGGGAQLVGSPLPDITEIVTHSATTLGGPDFGRPRYPGETGSALTPFSALALWRPTVGHLEDLAPDPQDWPIAYGLAAQQMLRAAAGPSIPVDLSGLIRVIMDSALTTAKLLDDGWTLRAASA